jgi:phospholipase C
VVSPYARKGYVSHVVHDHTSILKLVETKWNLPALTYRDANADNLLDCLDLTSPPAFLTPPSLPAPADPSGVPACTATTPSPLPSAAP